MTTPLEEDVTKLAPVADNIRHVINVLERCNHRSSLGKACGSVRVCSQCVNYAYSLLKGLERDLVAGVAGVALAIPPANPKHPPHCDCDWCNP